MHRLILSTVDSQEEARRLAACVNVLPGIESTYRWQGAIERTAEWLLLIKSREDRVEALREALVEAHPYDVPECVVLPLEGGHRPYLDWIDASLDAG